jgi:REP element-mobilizing transposase RayT
MNLFHITWSTEGRLPFFPDEARRRGAVRKIVSCAGSNLACFCIVDEHVHVVIRGQPEIMRRRVRAITRSLRNLSAIPMDAARIRPIEDRQHAENVFGYVLDQPHRHGLPVHSALWSGNCLADMVGARCSSGLRLCHREVWPRHGAAEALAAVGLPRWTLEPVGIDHVARIGAHHLVQATATALCVSVPLDSQVPDVVIAKHVACSLAREAGLPLSAVAAAGGFSLRSAQRLASRAVPPAARRAVLTWLALEERVRRHPRRER